MTGGLVPHDYVIEILSENPFPADKNGQSAIMGGENSLDRHYAEDCTRKK